jgi:hypothetical protein
MAKVTCAIPKVEVDALTSTQSGSFVLIDAGRYYLRSDAALKVCSQLTGFWRYLAYLSIFEHHPNTHSRRALSPSWSQPLSPVWPAAIMFAAKPSN